MPRELQRIDDNKISNLGAVSTKHSEYHMRVFLAPRKKQKLVLPPNLDKKAEHSLSYHPIPYSHSKNYARNGHLQ